MVHFSRAADQDQATHPVQPAPAKETECIRGWVGGSVFMRLVGIMFAAFLGLRPSHTLAKLQGLGAAFVRGAEYFVPSIS